MEKHPIQLESLIVKELVLNITDYHSSMQDEQELNITYSLGTTEYDKENKVIAVGFICEVNNLDKKPFYIKVEILGIFSVDEEKFPIDKLDHWSKHNAPQLLMPYIRENVYSLSNKAGVKVILPLVTLPTFTR